jgi:NADH-quinone oxidoreductase subunit M
MITARLRYAFAVAVALAIVLAGPVGHAQTTSPGRGGRIFLSLPGGVSGPLVLTPGQGGWVGSFTVTNLGSDPLTVSRASIRGDEDDVRSPSHLSVRFVDAAPTSATLAPGAAKDLVVSWMPDKDPRVRQAFGHVMVTSTDEEVGEVAMGFRAQLPTGLGPVGAHLLSLLVVLPLLVVLLVGLLRLVGRRDDQLVRRASIAVAAAELVFAFWAWRRFVPEVGRADGNDGFQLVERAVWVRSLGAEWYVGVDGTSLPLVVLAAALTLVAVVVADAERRDDAYLAALAMLASSVISTLLALDLVVLFVSWELVFLALVLLVGGFGGARAQHAAAKLGTYGAIGSAALFIVLMALSRASGRSLLVDGAPVAHTMAIPELARTSLLSKTTLLGWPLLAVAWILLLVVAGTTSPIPPLHGWLPEVLEEGPASATILLGGVVVALGPYLLLRVGFGAAPEGARWVGAALAAFGALSTGWGSLCALAQRDLRRFVAYASIASVGTSLFGIGALTPQGIAGAMTALFAHGLAVAMLLGVAAALDQRVHTCQAPRLGGMAAETPGLAAILFIALGVSVGLPGLAGSWGVFLSLLGGFVWHPVLAVLLVAAMVVSVAAHARIARLVVFGRVDPAWRTNAYLEPYGGRFPDATSREIAAFVPLAAVALLLGVWPAPLVSAIEVAARSASQSVNPSGPE